MSEDDTSIFSAMPGQPQKSKLPIALGDCGIILKSNGQFQVFSTGVDKEALSKPLEEMNEMELGVYKMGQKLMALAVALSSDQVMDILTSIANDPSVVNMEMLENVCTQH